MSYIKFHIRRMTDSAGNTSNARISRLESDMADAGNYELNLIMHALSAPGGKVETVRAFLLDNADTIFPIDNQGQDRKPN